MDEQIHAFLQQLAEALIQQNWARAHEQLASWLQREFTPADLAFFLTEPIQSLNEDWNLEAGSWPGTVELDFNPNFPLTELKADPAELALPSEAPVELNEENYKGWYCLSLLSREDQDLELDGWCDLWVAVATENTQLKIAYLELHDLD